MTNADKIRAMTDQELAQWLCHLMTIECCDTTCPARQICDLASIGLEQWMAMDATENE